MLYVHKKSSQPIDPWAAVRHGGLNHLEGVKGKYLVLFNVDILQREGAWHYIFEFDVRESLEVSALAQLMGKEQRYPNDMNWKHWLGADATHISASVRLEILNMPARHARTNAVITDLREIPATRPVPGREPGDWNQVEQPPEDFVLTLSSD